jgi:hypothetical protein
MRARTALALVVSLMIVACGGGTHAPAPTSPTPSSPSPPSNQPPQIVSATISPSVGVKDLTTFTARAEGTDPDGEPVTFSWSAPGRGAVGGGPTFSFRGGDVPGPLTVTATDSHGATATATVPFSAPDLNAFFDGWFGPRQNVIFSMRLSRTGSVLTGTFTEIRSPGIWKEGTLDPADPGSIDSEGRFRMRVKIGSEDFILDGRLEPYSGGGISGQFLSSYVGSGRVIGGEFAGQSFIFGEHNPY